MSVRGQSTWQEINALPTIASLIEDGLREAREHYATLFEAQPNPHAFDESTIGRVTRVTDDSLEHCDVYEEQLRRWRSERLTDAQQQEVARLSSTTRELRLVLTEILALAEELASATTRQLSKTDAGSGSSTRCARTLQAELPAHNDPR